MKFTTAAAASTLLALVAAIPLEPVTSTGTGPDPTQVYIEQITTGGTGCPAGSVSSSISDDRSTFTLIFDDYEVSYGPGIPITESRKNCQLNVAIHYPAGFQYSIYSTTYRGYASIPTGQTGVQKATYYFSGSTQQASAESDFTGPYDDDYTATDDIAQTSTVWSPCGVEGMLNINSQVLLKGDASVSGLMTTDSIDGKFTQIVGIQWQSC